MNAVFYRYFKNEIYKSFFLFGLFFFFSGFILQKVFIQNELVHKANRFSYDIIAPKGSTIQYLSEALNDQITGDEVLPLSLYKTLQESYSVPLQKKDTAHAVVDPVWGSETAHFFLVPKSYENKTKLIELINKKTVAQYIDTDKEIKLMTQITDRSNQQLVLFYIFLVILFILLLLQSNEILKSKVYKLDQFYIVEGSTVLPHRKFLIQSTVLVISVAVILNCLILYLY